MDLVYASDPKTSASLRERMETRLGPHILDRAGALGYVARAYRLVSLDGAEPPSTTRVDEKARSRAVSALHAWRGGTPRVSAGQRRAGRLSPGTGMW